MRNLLLIALLAVTFTAIAEEEEAAPPAPPVYVELKPSLVTNLNGGPKYIRFEMQLLVHGDENKGLVEKYAPALRHELFLLLAEQDGRTLQTPDGKKALRDAALNALRGRMEAMVQAPVIEDLYFTSYYVR